MALFRKSAGARTTRREADALEVSIDASERGDTIAEIEVHGESFRQGELAALAGPKTDEGKNERVGVTLRCEPTNEHDCNAIRVEVMGQLVGYVAREQAIGLSPAMQGACGGAPEAQGLIVGGWKYADGDEGPYGIRYGRPRRSSHD